jgi:hypothetical protein
MLDQRVKDEDAKEAKEAQTGQAAMPGPARGLPRGALGAWWWQGTRTVLFTRPNWTGLHATPAIVACLFLVPSIAGILLERLYIDGPAFFYWPGLGMGWMSALVMLWACWLLVRDAAEGATPPRSAVALFAMLLAQSLPLLIAVSVVLVPMAREGYFTPSEDQASVIARVAWVAGLGWLFLAQAVLMWRSSAPHMAARLASVALVAAMVLLNNHLLPAQHWYPVPDEEEAEEAEESDAAEWGLTQEVMEAQSQVLRQSLQSLSRQRSGVIDVYAITFAPYAEEDVFRRESEMVAGVMQTRYGAEGRTLQLVNHPHTLESHPWATRLNLQRAIERMGQLMDRDEDVLFIHLTSHGARNGALAASFWPMEVEPVTPQLLKQWLDAAGIRHRILSISACYSGSWIAPLSTPDTLVMTAADADHTSYGCGRGSELTYFGRAMYQENLRTTWSFEEAHARARTVIEQREQEAGKTDGYSNPQIYAGERIREVLVALQAQRAAARH